MSEGPRLLVETGNRGYFSAPRATTHMIATPSGPVARSSARARSTRARLCRSSALILRGLCLTLASLVAFACAALLDAPPASEKLHGHTSFATSTADLPCSRGATTTIATTAEAASKEGAAFTSQSHGAS